MILYFSATGNSKYVAVRLTQSTEQEMISIVDCVREGRYSFKDRMIGIVSPTYDWDACIAVRSSLSSMASVQKSMDNM